MKINSLNIFFLKRLGFSLKLFGYKRKVINFYMSEARNRKNDQFHSAIFDSPGPPSVPQSSFFSRNKHEEKPSPFKDPNRNSFSSSSSPIKPSNTAPRYSNSFQSSVFEPPSQKEGKVNPFKPKDSIVFGTEQIEYSVKTPIKPFEPIYETTSSYEKKQIELYGVTNPKPCSPQIRSKSTDPKTRKSQDLNSEIFQTGNYEKIAQSAKKVAKRPFSPQLRKTEMHSSSIFGDTEILIANNTSKKKELKKKDQLASNIFGTSKEYPRNVKVVEEKEQEYL